MNYEYIGWICIAIIIVYVLVSSSWPVYLESPPAQPRDIVFSIDGTEAHVIDTEKNTIYKYTLSIAWNLSTLTFVSKSLLTVPDAPPATDQKASCHPRNEIMVLRRGNHALAKALSDERIKRYAAEAQRDAETDRCAKIAKDHSFGAGEDISELILAGRTK